MGSERSSTRKGATSDPPAIPGAVTSSAGGADSNAGKTHKRDATQGGEIDVGDGPPGQAVTYLDGTVLAALRGELLRLRAVMEEQKAIHIKSLQDAATSNHAVQTADSQMKAIMTMLSWQAPTLQKQ